MTGGGIGDGARVREASQEGETSSNRLRYGDCVNEGSGEDESAR